MMGTQEDATSSGSAAKLAFAQFAPLQVQNREGLTSELSSFVDSSGLAPDNAIMEQKGNTHDLGIKKFAVKQNQDTFPSRSGG